MYLWKLHRRIANEKLIREECLWQGDIASLKKRLKSLFFKFQLYWSRCTNGFISEIENCQTIFRTYVRTTFFQHSLEFCFVSEAKNFTRIQGNVPVENCEIVSKTAFRTWGLPQLRGVHFWRNSFSVALKALFTIRVVIR